MSTSRLVYAACVCVALCGCRKSEPASTPEQIAEVKARLASADALDGTVDQIVTRCATCKLGMDGSAKHELKAHGYTMRFCSGGCSKSFGKSLDASILALEIPEPEAEAEENAGG